MIKVDDTLNYLLLANVSYCKNYLKFIHVIQVPGILFAGVETAVSHVTCGGTSSLPSVTATECCYI